MPARLSGAVELLARVIETCLVLMLGTYLCLIVGQIVLRYLRVDLLYWSEELVRYLLVWSVLLGATVATHRNVHVRVDILENLLPRPSRRGLAIVNTIILLAFAGTLIWAGLLLSQRSGTMTASMLGIRMSLVYGVVALSGALDVIFLLTRLAQLLFDPEAAGPADEGSGAIDTAL
jgi:C4-dicarboxylate transporter DctQ subunit